MVYINKVVCRACFHVGGIVLLAMSLTLGSGFVQTDHSTAFARAASTTKSVAIPRHVTAMLQKSKRLLAKGERKRAIFYAKLYAQKVSRIAGKSHPAYAKALRQIAKIFRASGNSGGAQSLLAQAGRIEKNAQIKAAVDKNSNKSAENAPNTSLSPRRAAEKQLMDQARRQQKANAEKTARQVAGQQLMAQARARQQAKKAQARRAAAQRQLIAEAKARQDAAKVKAAQRQLMQEAKDRKKASKEQAARRAATRQLMEQARARQTAKKKSFRAGLGSWPKQKNK